MTQNLLNTVFSPVKIFCHDRMWEWKYGKNIYPITMEMGISGPGNCDNKCSFCMHGSYYQDKAMMPFGFYRKVIDELKELGTQGMIFSGSGEPLTNPEVVRFIEYTKEIGIDVALVTNGTAWRRRGVMETVIKDVSWTRTSLDAGTSETRRLIHGVDDFEHVLESLTILARMKKRMGSDCNIGAQMVVTEENWKEIIQATGKVKGTGIDYFQIKPVVFHPKDNKEQLPFGFWVDVLRLANEAKHHYEDDNYSVYVKYDQFEAIMKPDHDKSAYDECYAHFFPIIEATGMVYHCSQTRGLPDFEIGDLNEQTFSEFWNGERRQEVLNSIDVSQCALVCRCHWLNKMLKTVALEENAPSFV